MNGFPQDGRDLDARRRGREEDRRPAVAGKARRSPASSRGRAASSGAPTQPATIVWVEALDGGDLKKPGAVSATRCDRWPRRSQAQPVEVAKPNGATAGNRPIPIAGVALLTENDRASRPHPHLDPRWHRRAAKGVGAQAG
jgi:hypothetical protein